MNKRTLFLWVALCTVGCSRSAQEVPPAPPPGGSAADLSTRGSADASVEKVARADDVPPAPMPAADPKAGTHWPEELPTRWFEVSRDSKGSFVPVDCADRPLNQLVYREVPGGHQVVFQTPWAGEGFSLREVRRTGDGMELKLAPPTQKKPTTQLVYQRQGDGPGRWLRDGKPLEFYPMGDLNRWRVRRVCIGSPFYENTTEQEYLSALLAKPPKPGQEFQGRPPKPKLQGVLWNEGLLKGLPSRWIQLSPRGERTLLVGCDGVVRSMWLELRNEDGVLVLGYGHHIYVVTQVKHGPNGILLSLATPLEGTVNEEVRIHYTPGIAEATWDWTLVADAETETRRVLTLDAAQALPQRIVCQ